MVLEISLVLVSLLFLTSCYVIWNLNTKLESLEDWITDFINTIEPNFVFTNFRYRSCLLFN